jgi:hypothetical protein
MKNAFIILLALMYPFRYVLLILAIMIATVILINMSKGDLGQQCNGDGTCNGRLRCVEEPAPFHRHIYMCRL